MGEKKEKSPSGQMAAQPFLTQLLAVWLASCARRETWKLPARKVTTTSRVLCEIDIEEGESGMFT